MRVGVLPFLLLLLLPSLSWADEERAAERIARTRALLDDGRPRAALAHAEALRAEMARLPEPLELIADAHYALGDRTGLRSACEELVARWPNRTTGYWLLARSHIDAGRHESAIALYRRFLERQPDHVPAGLALASSLRWDREDPAAAGREYARLCTLVPLGSPQAREAEAGRDEAQKAIELRRQLRSRRGSLQILVGVLAAVLLGLTLAAHRLTRRVGTGSPERGAEG